MKTIKKGFEVVDGRTCAAWPEAIKYNGKIYSNSAFLAAHGFAWESGAGGKRVFYLSEDGEAIAIKDCGGMYRMKTGDVLA